MEKSEIFNRVASITSKELWQTPEVLNYLLLGRGLFPETIKKFRLGFDNNNIIAAISKKEGWFNEAVDLRLVSKTGVDAFNGYVLFPIIFNGTIVNFYGRYGKGLTEFPHKFPDGSSKQFLYNADNILKYNSIILTEAPIDTLTLEQNGFVSAAICGITLPSSALYLFKDKKCFIMFDNDAAGKRGALLLARKLFRVTSKISIITLGSDSIGSKTDVNEFFNRVGKAKKRIEFLLKNSVELSKRDIPLFNTKQKNKKIDIDAQITDVAKLVLDGYDYVEKNGALWVRCPKHNAGTERKRSLWIGGKKNIFTCFGCGVGGDVFKFVSWWLNLTTEETLKWFQKNKFC